MAQGLLTLTSAVTMLGYQTPECGADATPAHHPLASYTSHLTDRPRLGNHLKPHRFYFVVVFSFFAIVQTLCNDLSLSLFIFIIS